MNAISVWEEPQTVQSSSTAVFRKHLTGAGWVNLLIYSQPPPVTDIE